MYVHKARMQATNRIYPSLSPPHLPFRRPFHSASLSLSLPSLLALCLSLSLSLRGPVTSRGSSIQIAFPLGILNLWHARCALLILDHAYASWILQRSPKGPKGYCAFFDRVLDSFFSLLFTAPLFSVYVCVYVSARSACLFYFVRDSPFPSSFSLPLYLLQKINLFLARRSVTPGNIAFLG